MIDVPFEKFPKIPRLRRAVVITEKIDGTNASITILEDGRVIAGSRTRYITPDDDNFGFAKWVHENEDALRDTLGVGRHFGEWWGRGIQRGYGLDERRFSLFNTARWGDIDTNPDYIDVKPAALHVVPTIYTTFRFSTIDVLYALDCLRIGGSYAAPGYDNPEGVVVYHAASNALFKQTLDGDGAKGAA